MRFTIKQIRNEISEFGLLELLYLRNHIEEELNKRIKKLEGLRKWLKEVLKK